MCQNGVIKSQILCFWLVSPLLLSSELLNVLIGISKNLMQEFRKPVKLPLSDSWVKLGS